MNSYHRDVRELKKSFRILEKYIDLCNSGDYDFASDIPTQIYKSFFDKNERNSHQTLFERVCSSNDIIVKFYPLFVLNLAIVIPEQSTSFSKAGSRPYIVNTEPIPLSEWQEHIVQIVMFRDKPEEMELVSIPKNITEHELNNYLINQALAKGDMFTVIQAGILAQRGFTLNLTPVQQTLKQKMEDEAQVNNGKSLHHWKIVHLSIEDLFRTIRHKDSAHSDPLNHPKYENEHDKLRAAKAITSTSFEDGSETSYEKLIVGIAEYMVQRGNEALLEIFDDIE